MGQPYIESATALSDNYYNDTIITKVDATQGFHCHYLAGIRNIRKNADFMSS